MTRLMRRLLGSTAMFVLPPRSAVIRVGPNEVFKTLQAAVDYASSLLGDRTIYVAPGVYGNFIAAAGGGFLSFRGSKA